MTIRARSVFAWSVRSIAVAFCLSLTLAAAPLAQADPPLGIGGIFQRKVEFDPSRDYQLTTSNGPWMIMCASFVGEAGRQEAYDLVRELRAEFNLEAFVYTHEFDLSGPIEGKGWQLRADGKVEPHRMRHLLEDNFLESAVLVGNYDAVDSRQAKRSLEKVKRIRPQTLTISDNRRTHQPLGVLREFFRLNHPDREVQSLGPMRSAFVTTNPMISDEYFTQSGPDRLIMSLNKDAEYSLLACPAPFSVRVATFRGESTFNLERIEEAKEEFNMLRMFNRPAQSKLAEATEKAHALTMALRERGWQAYEFHDRFESYVCVGAYEWVGIPQQNGTQEINPEVLEIMERFKARPRSVVDKDGQVHHGAMQPLSLPEVPGVMFDIQPEPIQVPHQAARETFRR